MRQVKLGLVTFGCMLGTLSPPALASPPIDTAFDRDPSARAAGMGRASAAVFWGMLPNYWSNPALLGQIQGTAYEYTRCHLVPSLSDDAYFTAERWALGVWGIGVFVAGEPGRLPGRLKLDYGTMTAVDEEGNPLGTFTPKEKIKASGIGVSLAQLGDSLFVRLARRPLGLSRYFDVSFGQSHKRVEIYRGPASVLREGALETGRFSSHDRGVLIRITPYNTLDAARRRPAPRSGGEPNPIHLRVDLAFGASVQNRDEPTFPGYYGAFSPGPTRRWSRTGWAARAVFDPRPGPPPRRLTPWGRRLIPSTFPLLSVSGAWDGVNPSWYDPIVRARLREPIVHYSGAEISVADLVHARVGTIHDANVHDRTFGFGFGPHAPGIGGLRFDWSSVPERKGFDRTHPWSLVFWIDPASAFIRI